MAFIQSPLISTFTPAGRRSKLCSLQRASPLYPSRSRLGDVGMTSVDPIDPSFYEDDDATLGDPGPVMGMQMPDLTEADKEYLDGARNGDDFMARMTHIAHRLDHVRRAANKQSGRLSPDDYMKSLKGPAPDLSSLEGTSGFRPADAYINSLKTGTSSHVPDGDFTSTGLNAGEAYMAALAKDHADVHAANAADPNSSPPSETELDIAQLDAEAEAVARKLRELTGTGAATGEVDDLVVREGGQGGGQPSAEALKYEIERLEKELSAANGVAFSEDSGLRPIVQSPGAGGDGDRAEVPQEMSEDEKMAVFDAIRKRAMAQRETGWSDELADPLARTLPTGEPRVAGADPLQELRTCLAEFAQESRDRLTAHERRVEELLRRIGEAENGGPM